MERLSDEERRRLLESAHFGPKAPASGSKGVVICSHPLATRAGVDVLKAGGKRGGRGARGVHLPDPSSNRTWTGITGVLSMLHFDAATGETTYVNGSAARPAAAIERRKRNGAGGLRRSFEPEENRKMTKLVQRVMGGRCSGADSLEPHGDRPGTGGRAGGG